MLLELGSRDGHPILQTSFLLSGDSHLRSVHCTFARRRQYIIEREWDLSHVKTDLFWSPPIDWEPAYHILSSSIPCFCLFTVHLCLQDTTKNPPLPPQWFHSLYQIKNAWVEIDMRAEYLVSTTRMIIPEPSKHYDFLHINFLVARKTCGSGGPHPNSTTILKNFTYLTLEVRMNLR